QAVAIRGAPVVAEFRAAGRCSRCPPSFVKAAIRSMSRKQMARDGQRSPFPRNLGNELPDSAKDLYGSAMTLGKSVRKAVIPAAGLGTRFLPATKAMPKEMLPVVDQPAIQYVGEKAAKAGLTDLLMITGRQKRALEDHFDRAPALEQTLELKGDLDRLEAVQHASSLAPLHYLRQGDPKGRGHAVLCAR